MGAKLKIGKCKDIRDWFLANEFADFGDPVTNFFMSRRLPKDFVCDKNVQQKVVDYFASFDEHIRDFRIEKVPQEGDSKEEKYKIHALHNMIGSDEMAEIPLELESAGTLKMFALYPELQEVLEKGSVFFIDELNARLHPLLVRNFLLTFLNPEINTNHAQLVFTTHDTWQLSNQLLRRDEIWFVEKDEEGVSTLYSLSDFVDKDGTRIRKDESYEKNYLIGKYGAIPKLKKIDVLRDRQVERLTAYAINLNNGGLDGEKENKLHNHYGELELVTNEEYFKNYYIGIKLFTIKEVHFTTKKHFLF